jgi:hypothetical protein
MIVCAGVVSHQPTQVASILGFLAFTQPTLLIKVPVVI